MAATARDIAVRYALEAQTAFTDILGAPEFGRATREMLDAQADGQHTVLAAVQPIQPHPKNLRDAPSSLTHVLTAQSPAEFQTLVKQRLALIIPSRLRLVALMLGHPEAAAAGNDLPSVDDLRLLPTVLGFSASAVCATLRRGGLVALRRLPSVGDHAALTVTQRRAETALSHVLPKYSDPAVSPAQKETLLNEFGFSIVRFAVQDGIVQSTPAAIEDLFGMPPPGYRRKQPIRPYQPPRS